MSDDLRARLTALAERWEREYGANDNPWLTDLRALLADPAPEAVREIGGHLPSECLEAGGPCFFGVSIRGYHLPADLPVATGVTTEDEGCKECGQTVAMHTRGGRNGLNRWCTPAPAPVVSAGDEGVGLSELLADAIDAEWLRPEHDCDGTEHQCTQRCPRPAYQRMSLDELRDAAVTGVSPLLAARVAEAGARAHDELAAMIIRLAQSNAILARANGRGDDERRWLDLIHVMEADKALGVDR